MTRNEAIAKIIDALDALQLLPPFPADEATVAQTHHRLDPTTVSAPHPTTTTGQSAKPTDQSWQRQPTPPDHPAGTA